MKVIINNTEAAIFTCGKLLIPGTNVLDDKEFDEGKDDAQHGDEGAVGGFGEKAARDHVESGVADGAGEGADNHQGAVAEKAGVVGGDRHVSHRRGRGG